MKLLSPVVLIASGLACVSCTTLDLPPAEMSKDAEAVLRRMSQRIASSPAVGVRARRVIAPELVGGTMVRPDSRIEILLRRPGQARATISTDQGRRTLWIDRGDVTFFNEKEKFFARLSGPKELDRCLDWLQMNYELPMPLSELLASDSFRRLRNLGGTITLAGRESIAGTACDLVAGRTEAGEWKLWLGVGDALPRKIQLFYADLPKSDGILTTITSWDLAAQPAPDSFVPRIPADATEVEFRALPAR
jgi:hypothetical protein